MSISDHRWAHDVTRLAKVIAFDLPGSAVERQLNAVNFLICVALMASVALTTTLAGWNAFHGKALLSTWQSGVNYVFLFPAAVLLLGFAKDMEPSSNALATVGGLVGFLAGGLAIIALNLFSNETERAEPIMLFAASTVLITAMLGLMSLSGFRPKW